MAQPIGRTGRLLRQVRAGMAVYDRHHALVGTVTAVSLGEDATARGPRGQLAGGFVEIEADPFAAHHYAGGGQIAAVDGERVLLNVGRDYLATR
jgi:hypothetical protein